MTTPPRRLLSLLGVTVLVGALGACGAGSRVGGVDVSCDVDAPSSPVTIDVLAYSSPSMDPFTAAMTNGCADVEGLTVEHSPVDFAAQLEKAQLSLSQEEGTYDIVETYSGTLPQYASQGWLAPLDDFYRANEADLEDIDPRLLERARYDGRLYMLPMQANVHAMVYRKDVLEKAGVEPPTTMDEVVAAAEKIEATGMVDSPLALSFSADADITTAFNNSLASLGGQWVDPRTDEPQLTSATSVRAMESLKRLLPYLPSDAMRADAVSVSTQVQNGDVAMSILYTGSMAAIDDPEKSEFAGQFGFAAPPAVETGGGPWATLNLDGYSVAANSDDDAGLVASVAAVGAGQDAAKDAGRLAFPVRQSVRDDPGLSKEAPYWDAGEQALDAGADTYPAKPYFVPLQTAVRPFIADGVSGKRPVEEALRLAQQEAEKVVAQYR